MQCRVIFPPENLTTIYTGSANTYCSKQFRGSAPAAGVSIIENKVKQRTFIERFDEASVVEMAYACVASTIEVLTQPCIIRVITQCEPMLLTMTGKIRLQGYYEQRIRMQKAIKDGGHTVEWSKPKDDYEHRIMSIAYEAAIQVANLDDENSLDVIADQTTIITSYIRDPKLIQKMILQQDQNSAQNLFQFFRLKPGNLVYKMRRILSSFLSKLFS
jgi:hypothetical protein